MPPAAPAPGTSFTATPSWLSITCAKCAREGVQCGDTSWTHLSAGRTRAAPVGPVSGFGHVAGGGDGDVLESRIHRADIDGGQIGESRSPVLKVVAVPVQKTNAKGLQKSGTGVVGGAAAEPDDDALGSGTDGGEHEFAGAVGGGDQRGCVLWLQAVLVRWLRLSRPRRSCRRRADRSGLRQAGRAGRGPARRASIRQWRRQARVRCLHRRRPWEGNGPRHRGRHSQSPEPSPGPPPWRSGSL